MYKSGQSAALPEQQLLLGQKAYDTEYSQTVSHSSTNSAQCCLTSVIGRELVFSTWCGRRHSERGKLTYDTSFSEQTLIFTMNDIYRLWTSQELANNESKKITLNYIQYPHLRLAYFGFTDGYFIDFSDFITHFPH